jgi:hypothetical protein
LPNTEPHDIGRKTADKNTDRRGCTTVVTYTMFQRIKQQLNTRKRPVKVLTTTAVVVYYT